MIPASYTLRRLLTLLALMVVSCTLAAAVGASGTLAQSPGSALGSDDSSTFGDAQDRAANEREDASPEEEQDADSIDPDRNEPGTFEGAQEDSADQRDDASPEEEENADRADPDRDETSTQGEAQEDGAEQAENATEEEEEAADGDDSEGGFLEGMAVDMIGAILGRLGEGVEEAGDRRAEDLSDQITDGRYMLEPPNNGLTEIYEDFANFVKPIAIVLFLFLGLSMALRGANHDTAYAAQTGIPKIVTVLAGIAFMPEIIGVVADVSREISNAVIDEQAMQEGFTRLEDGKDFRQWIGFSGPFADGIFSVIKFIFGVLILLAIAIRNLVFGLLYVIGPLAIGLYGFPQFADVAGAWFRGILACFVISILWALEFGIGYRFVAEPGLLTGGGAWPVLPTLFSIGILWLVWKTPWWVFQWAFYSYSAGGGGGISGARTAISLLGLFKGRGKGGG